MSGPKGASYTVVSEAELRRRAVEEARARVRACARQIDEQLLLAGHEAAKVGRRPALAARATTVAALNDEERTGQEYLERLRAVVAERSRGAAAAQLTASLAGLRIAVDFAPAPAAPAPTAFATGTPDHRARLAALAQRLPEVGGADRGDLAARLRTVADALPTADAGRAAQLVAAFETRVADALHRAADRASFERRREALAREFADVPPGDPAARALATASDDHDLGRARTLLVAVREQLHRAADQDFAVAQAAAVLQALGYRVDTEPGRGVDVLVARKDAWPHHGLRLLFPESEAAFTTVPEAYGATDARDDVAFERASCRDLNALVAQLSTQGVHAELRLQRAPGAVPLRRIGAVDQPAAVAHPEREASL